MAFDPIQEDCLRLVLEDMRARRVFPLDNPEFVNRCMEVYREEPSRLIRTDRDRSFHLVTLATELLDYRIPFIPSDEEADKLADEAESRLREAVLLDEGNWDAERMLAAVTLPSNDDYVSYLIEHEAEVKASFDEIAASAGDPYSREYVHLIAWRPYVRWLASLASSSFIAGKYRISIDAAERCLDFAPHDPADIRRTALLAMAKLECTEEELLRFQRRTAAAGGEPQRGLNQVAQKAPDAWFLLAKIAIAYRSFSFSTASAALQELIERYPRAAEPLFYQAEFPEGVFSRVNVDPDSQDELILAISEATPLLQEGFGAPNSASFSTWIADHKLVLEELDGRAPDARPARYQARGDAN